VLLRRLNTKVTKVTKGAFLRVLRVPSCPSCELAAQSPLDDPERRH